MSEKLAGKRIKGITKHGEEYEGIVVAIDFEKGITIDTLEPEKLEKLGYCLSENDHMYCLNFKSCTSSDYNEEFKTVVKMIQKGVFDGRITEANFYGPGWAEIASCAFE